MVTDNKTALVLEGGGLRGVFTCGVLDCFMDHGIRYLLTQGCIMDFKLLFEDFPEKIIPYDYDAYFSNQDRITEGVYKKKMSCVTHVRHLIITT